MPARTLHPLRLALASTFLLVACGGDDDGGPPGGACAGRTTYAIGSTVNGSLATTDSVFEDGTFIDLYCLVTTSQQSLEIDLTSGDFDTFLWVFGGVNRADSLAVDDDGGSGFNSSLRILMGSGTYVLGANSFATGETGAYTLSSSSVAQEVTDCVINVWVTKGITTAQQISATDCDDGAGALSDFFLIVLKPDQAVTITESSSAFDAVLRLYDSSFTQVATDDNSGGGTNARIVYTSSAGFTDVFVIEPATKGAGETGSYSLSVQ